MLVGADFDTAFSGPSCKDPKPMCTAPTCFIASYAPVSKLGVAGPFNVNSQYLQPNRYYETVGPVTIRSQDFNFKC